MKIFKLKNKVVPIILIITLIISCSKKEFVEKSEQDYTTIGEPVAGDWLISVLSSEPDTLNPITATDAAESIINKHIYEALITRDNETHELKPLLAHKWEVSKDKLQFTFYMRKGIKWHDGRELTARDVIFSYNKIKDPKVDAPHLRHYYRDVKKVEMLDKYTVKFTYRRPYFLALIFCGGMPILPEHIFNKGDFNKHPNNRLPVGTGQYIFEKWETGKQIVLRQNPDYWDKEKTANIKKIVYKIITDETVRLQLLKKGNIDISGLSSIQWTKQTRSRKFLKVHRKLKFYRPYYNYIGWNMRKKIFKDRDVREAMTRLINRRSILKNILYDLGQITTGPFYVFSKDYDKTVKPYEYNPEKAKELLAGAGWKDSDNDGILDKDGQDFKFSFLITSGSIFAEQLATILKENLKKVGIIMDIRKLEWATFLHHIDDHKYDAVVLGWSMGIETDPYQLWHSSQTMKKGSNHTGFVNKRVDELIEKGRMEFDVTKRMEMFKEIHRIIHYQQPYTFMYCLMSKFAVDRRFQNTRIYIVQRDGVDVSEWWVPLKMQKY